MRAADGGATYSGGICRRVRLVFARIVSLNLFRLFARGQRLPASKW